MFEEFGMLKNFKTSTAAANVGDLCLIESWSNGVILDELGDLNIYKIFHCKRCSSAILQK